MCYLQLISPLRETLRQFNYSTKSGEEQEEAELEMKGGCKQTRSEARVSYIFHV